MIPDHDAVQATKILIAFLFHSPTSSMSTPLLLLMAASIFLVTHVRTSLVDLSRLPTIAVYASFSYHRNNLLALTVNSGSHGSFTTVLEFSVQQNLAVVSLGPDWTSSV
jgi:hypothetical protein